MTNLLEADVDRLAKAAGRSCGDCALCCRLLDVPAAGKPRNDWCPHCNHHSCKIYQSRPQICRDYTTKECEYDDDWTYDFYLETAEQVAEYTEAILQEPGKSIRSPKPPLLPVLS